MSYGYAIFNINIINQENYKEYIDKVKPLAKKFGAEYIIRGGEKKFNYSEMKCITMPMSQGPIFLKANQKTGEIHARIEYGLGEGILISCHNDDNSVTSRTIGPFPLDFFRFVC